MSQTYDFELTPDDNEYKRLPKREFETSYDPAEESDNISKSLLSGFMRMANEHEWNLTMGSLGFDFCEDFTKEMRDGVPDDFYDIAEAYELKFYCVEKEANKYEIFVFYSPEGTSSEDTALDLVYDYGDNIDSKCLPEVADYILRELRTSIQSYLQKNNTEIIGGVQTSIMEFPQFSLKAKRAIMDTIQGQSVCYDRIVGGKRQLARFKYLTTDILEAFELDKSFRIKFDERDKAIILGIYEDYIVL